MHPVLLLVLLAVAAVIVWALVGAFTGVGMPRLPVGTPHPARTREEALAALRILEDADGPEVAEPCRTQLLRPQGPPRGTLVILHGFTNSPPQFAEVAEILCGEGYFVLVPRMPHHGLADLVTHDLANLTAEELVTFGHRCIDIAAGLPGPVSVIGLSAGASMAAWAGAARDEVERVVACAPLVSVKAIPMPVGRLLVRFSRFVPSWYLWWDPRKKANLGESPHVYPGFPLRGLVPFLHVGAALYDQQVVPAHELQRVALTSNPHDIAIRRDVAREMMRRTYTGHARSLVELTIAASLNWLHDFVDQHVPHHGTPEQVAALLLTALGESDDDTAGGVVSATSDLAKETHGD